MPISHPNFLTPSGYPGEEVIDSWKTWLVAGTLTDNPSLANDTDLIMVLNAACDHIAMDLYIHADSLIRRAQTPAYGPIEIRDGEWALKQGRMYEWEAIRMTAIVNTGREALIEVIAFAWQEIRWLKGEIARLEAMMEVAHGVGWVFIPRERGFGNSFAEG